MKVKLEDIIEAMEFANMETEYYYDTHNEKVLMLFDGMVDGEDNPQLFEDIKEGFVEDYNTVTGTIRYQRVSNNGRVHIRASGGKESGCIGRGNLG